MFELTSLQLAVAFVFSGPSVLPSFARICTSIRKPEARGPTKNVIQLVISCGKQASSVSKLQKEQSEVQEKSRINRVRPMPECRC